MLPPPRPLPPIIPGAARSEVFEAVLSFAVPGALADVNTAIFAGQMRSSVASIVGVKVDRVSIHLTEGSVIVTARIVADSGGEARLLVTSMTSQLNSTSMASARLGVPVTAIPTAVVSTTLVVIPAPLLIPAPAPPATPSASPDTGKGSNMSESGSTLGDKSSSEGSRLPLIIVIAAVVVSAAGLLVLIGVLRIVRHWRRTARARKRGRQEGEGGAVRSSDYLYPSSAAAASASGLATVGVLEVAKCSDVQLSSETNHAEDASTTDCNRVPWFRADRQHAAPSCAQTRGAEESQAFKAAPDNSATLPPSLPSRSYATLDADGPHLTVPPPEVPVLHISYSIGRDESNTAYMMQQTLTAHAEEMADAILCASSDAPEHPSDESGGDRMVDEEGQHIHTSGEVPQSMSPMASVTSNTPAGSAFASAAGLARARSQRNAERHRTPEPSAAFGRDLSQIDGDPPIGLQPDELLELASLRSAHITHTDQHEPAEHAEREHKPEFDGDAIIGMSAEELAQLRALWREHSVDSELRI